MPIWWTPVPSSAQVSRRFAAGRCITLLRRCPDRRGDRSTRFWCTIFHWDAAAPRLGLAPIEGPSQAGRRRAARSSSRLWRSVVEKIWLKHYPKGVPAEIDINEYASIRDVFEESVAKYGPRPAFSCMGKTITFAELDRL